MKKKFFHLGEFNKKKLIFYFILNILAFALLVVFSFIKVKHGIGVYILVIVFLMFYIICLYLLYEFIISIPKTKARLRNIVIGSALLLGLILLTYANLYLQVYRIKGDKAFNFSGKSLSGNDFLYYSITTFTTTGYGDITSIGITSNAIAASEMILGMVTNTVLMAIIAAKLITKLNNN
ncbi:ion channel [Peribacillus alkalitolerans]|uniref:ion channel n=1 Tax=Peribacillus alkalitolerans TaxID=1550385 RepID=UPI0013D82E87|nr:ion channel [Peribacillus alkalitolerans]